MKPKDMSAALSKARSRCRWYKKAFEREIDRHFETQSRIGEAQEFLWAIARQLNRPKTRKLAELISDYADRLDISRP